MPPRGHLFVVQADLSRIAADAFLIPCDDKLQVAGGWRPFIEPGSKAQASSEWFQPRGLALQDGLALLPDQTPSEGERGPDEVVGLRVLVDTVGVASIDEMVDRSMSGVSLAAQAKSHGRRALPLVAMPILGVGQGKFPGQRAEVVRKLIGRLHAFGLRSRAVGPKARRGRERRWLG